ncbi:nucleotidyltransferase domain-containing protein [Candidatus Omnitrophota bacterium]
MTKRVSEAVNEFQNRLILRDGKKIDAIMLYGSVANGRYSPKDSDIDIIVFSKDKGIDEHILEIETDVSLKYNVVISALLSTKKEFKDAEKAGYSFPKEVLKGRVLYERN